MFKFLDHTADFGLYAEGKTTEEAFEEAAKGLFSVMTDLKKVKAVKKIDVKVEAPKMDELFIEWLNFLLSESYSRKMLFTEFKVGKISAKSGKFVLKGWAKGEKMNSKKHELIRDVKGASYSGLKAEKKGNKFIVQCVLDV